MQAKTKRDEIRVMLTRSALPKTWLIAQLEAVGTVVDAPRLNKMLTGSIRGSAAEKVIDESYKILCHYETAMSRVGQTV